MKTKYFKVGGEWKKVSISGEEEKKLSQEFISDYFDLLKKILRKADENGFRGTDALKVSLAVFDKSASPLHYKFDELLEERKDESLSKQGRQKTVKKNY